MGKDWGRPGSCQGWPGRIAAGIVECRSLVAGEKRGRRRRRRQRRRWRRGEETESEIGRREDEAEAEAEEEEASMQRRRQRPRQRRRAEAKAETEGGILGWRGPTRSQRWGRGRSGEQR